MVRHTDDTSTRVSRSRRIATTLGTSAGYAALLLGVSFAIIGEDLPTALWQSLFCFIAVTVLTLVVALIRRGDQSSARQSDTSDS